MMAADMKDILGAVVVVGGIALAFWVARRQSREKARALGGRARFFEVTGERAGLPFRYDQKGVLMLLAPVQPDMTVGRLGWLARFSERIGYSRPQDTGDAEFDARYYVESATPELAVLAIGRPGVRKAIASVLALTSSVSMGGRGLRVRIRQAHKQPPSVLLDLLIALHDVVERAPASESPRRGRRWLRVGLSLVGLVCCIPVFSKAVSAGHQLTHLAARDMMLDCTRIVAVFAVGSGIIVAWRVRGRTHALGKVIGWLIVSFVIPWPFLNLGMAAGNEFLDRSEPTTIEVSSFGVYDGSKTPSVWFASWRPEGGVDRLGWSSLAEKLTEVDVDKLRFRVAKGAFGYERVEHVTYVRH